MRISHSFSRSSSMISRMKSGLKGSISTSTRRMAVSMSRALSTAWSLYIRSVMKIFSSEASIFCSRVSCSWISSSLRSISRVRRTESRRSSVTFRNSGLRSRTTQQLELSDTSQLVKAYSASMVLSLDTPG